MLEIHSFASNACRIYPCKGATWAVTENSHKVDEVPRRPEKVQPHRREIRSYSKVYGQLVSVREGKPCWTGSGLPLHVVTQIDAVIRFPAERFDHSWPKAA